MSNMKNDVVPFGDLKKKIGGDAAERYAVRSRGRPETDPAEAQQKRERRKHFGEGLKTLRKSQGLTLAAAAEAAGIASARKLSQYETTCYPPGWVVCALAPVYNVDAKTLAARAIASSDPDMFRALSGDRSVEEFVEDNEE
jgi:hypothetical protein